MEFRILGSLEAHSRGTLLPLGGTLEQKLLGALLLDAGRTVLLGRLIEVLWGDDPPATAAKQVRNAVSRLRKLLAYGGAAGVIVTEHSGYRLVLTDCSLDAHLFDATVRQADLAASAGRATEATGLLRTALSLRRGPLLGGMTGRIIEAAATAWEERYCAISETYYEQLLSLGRHGEILAELTAFAAEHPIREKPVAQLMLGLYRSGRQADALNAYRDTRAMLVKELGLEPSLELQRLHQQILAGDPALNMTLAGDGGSTAVSNTRTRQQPDHALWPIPRQLPAAVRHFTGRINEIRALEGLLREMGGEGGTAVISAIDGTAGIGKTALAIYWAHQVAPEFPDGQLYVNLRGFDPSGTPAAPEEAIRVFLDALQVPPSRIPSSLDSQTALYRTLLSDRRILIVLDNARDAGQVRPLLPGSAGSLVIVTSRNRLASLVAAENALPITLDLLTAGEAHQFLSRRLGPERLLAEPAAVSALIGLCSRLPLALGMASARAALNPRLSLTELARQLHEAQSALDAFDVGDTSANVRAVFSWSYQNLDPAAAHMFRLLGIHPGPDITTPAAASLAGIPGSEAQKALDGLARAHLIAEYTPGRYAFHDLLRAYAAEQAAVTDSDDKRREALERVLDHYLHTSYAADRLLNPAREDPVALPPFSRGVMPEELLNEQQASNWLEAEHQVLLALIDQAITRGFDAHVWQLSWALATFLDWRGHWNDCAATQHAALAAAERLGDRGWQARTHQCLGWCCSRLGDNDRAVMHCQQALDLCRQLGDRAGQARAYRGLGWVSEQQGYYQKALEYIHAALELYRSIGHERGQIGALTAVGWINSVLGNYQEALTYCQQALALERDAGNFVGQAHTWDSLGYAHYHLGQNTEAIRCYQRALSLFKKVGDRYDQAIVLTHLGDAHDAVGDRRAAGRVWRQALVILDEMEHPEAEGLRSKLAR